MRRVLPAVLALAAALGITAAAKAQTVVADLSQSRVAITTNFAGSQILVFGAVQETGPDAGTPFDIIVTVSGPREPVTVRKKDRVAGIWVNTEAVDITAAPAFYAISTNRRMEQILSMTEDLRRSITIPRAIRSAGLASQVDEAEEFTEALIRLRERNGSYRVEEHGVTMIGQPLFRTDINLPSNISEGRYTARIFMLRDKEVIASYTDVLDVRKVGLERWIYNLAQEQAMIYGLLSLAIAMAAGWGASAAFRYIRGS
ncbi:TIGR02186 family protein [Tropicimonas sediminicola]|uniref:Transmembrane protein (Alph_Pro_TM) n=1 Tax=Tropicimonas sediminicola TaxID=1031541 RepID=A0A239F0D3_9RHOB|nr:TIGR02186 family protein [Tropicimonas sediminicola]SNS49743.1 conserved hypothetical protein [Tropicimonas sediminicola]